MEDFYQLVNAAIISSNITYSRWVTEELFSPSWLIITATLAISCILLFLLIDKSRLRELLLFGSLLAFLFGVTDVIATEYGLWEYKTHIIPLKSSVFPFSFTMNPIFQMLAYQYGKSWRSFAVLNTAVNAFFAFVAHPFFVWTDVLWLGNWNYFFSFGYLMLVTFGLRAIIIWLASIEQRHAAEDRRISVFPPLYPVMKQFDGHKNKEK